MQPGAIFQKFLSRNDNNKKVRCQVTNPFFDEIIDDNETDTAGFSSFLEYSVTCK